MTVYCVSFIPLYPLISVVGPNLFANRPGTEVHRSLLSQASKARWCTVSDVHSTVAVSRCRGAAVARSNSGNICAVTAEELSLPLMHA
eukprot:4123-Heterococcus_DN1.PRE.3